MDIDISKMFKEKNKEVFKNSLTLEMERNLESLKNTTDNSVSLEINKLFLFFKTFFIENSINYKKEDLLGFLYRERKTLNDLINNKIEEKKIKIKEEFINNKETDEDVLDENYLDKYFDKLNIETEKINEELDLLLTNEITINFSSELSKKYTLKTPEQLERINSRVNVLFKNNIITKIKEQIKFRDESLKNMANESFNKYLDLNKKTIV